MPPPSAASSYSSCEPAAGVLAPAAARAPLSGAGAALAAAVLPVLIAPAFARWRFAAAAASPLGGPTTEPAAGSADAAAIDW